MAYFDPEDLINAIRHEFIVEDETGFCSKILTHPQRKSKAGGLPLNFRSAVDPDSNYESDSLEYLAADNFESTSALIQEHLKTKLPDRDQSESKHISIDEKGAIGEEDELPDDFFHYREISTERPSNFSSVTSKLLKNDGTFIIDPKLAAYAKYSSTNVQNNRKLVVFYPFADALEGELHGCSLTIDVLPYTRITDVIGLCCYQYVRHRRTPEIEDISQYQLLMASEDGEIDGDLPAVDGYRLLSELGSCWSTVALTKRSMILNSNAAITTVVVYTISGSRYEFSVNSLDFSLRWLRDQALQKRIEEEGSGFLSEYPELREYVLEAINQPGIALNLDLSINSMACSEFVLLRINSCRSEFNSAQPLILSETVSTTKLCPDSESTSPYERPQRFDSRFSVSSGIQTSSSSSPLPVKSESLGSLVAEYFVDVLRPYRYKWSASMIIGSEGFEISALQVNQKRNSLFLTPTHRTKIVSWNCVGGVDIIDRIGAKRIVRIFWLSIKKMRHPSELPHKIHGSHASPTKRRSIASYSGTINFGVDTELISQKLYSDSDWRLIQLETSVDNALNIAQTINKIVEDVNSEVYQLFKFSECGTKIPSEAAIEAQRTQTLSAPIQLHFGRPSAFSRLTSTIANAFPPFHKRISKYHSTD